MSLTFLWILLAMPLFSQYGNLPESKNYLNATVSFMDYSKVEVSNLIIGADSIEFYDTSSKTTRKESLETINYIRVSSGSKAGKYATIGGISMALISLAAVVSVNSDPTMELAPNVGLRIFGFIAGGALLGAAIGSGAKESKTYYIEKPLSFIDDVNLNLVANNHMGKRCLGLSLRVVF